MREAAWAFILSVLPVNLLRLLFRLPNAGLFQYIHSWPEKCFPWTSKRVTFTLSFDCDSPLDAQAILPALLLLNQHEIVSSFAVCGSLVAANEASYREIIGHGHELINHGYSRHVEYDREGVLRPTLFYRGMSRQQIREEIHKNHSCLTKMLGAEITGFRSPHFGCFQRREDFSFLYSILSELGYTYSTSSLAHVYRRLRLWENRFGIREFPLSGYAGRPFSVFDSWSFIQNGGPDRLLGQFRATLDMCLRAPRPIWFNIYLDPSHVVDSGILESLLGLLRQNTDRIEIMNYAQILRRN